MMTSRAEFRLVLREDNTIERLSGVARKHGLLSERDFDQLSELVSRRTQLLARLNETQLVPNAATQTILTNLKTSVLNKPISCADLLRRDEISSLDLRLFGVEIESDENVHEPVEIHVKYEGYIRRQGEMVDQARKMEEMSLPLDLEYGKVRGLSREEVEKLTRIRPRSLGQAQRISGVNPSAIQAILVFLKGRQRSFQEFSVEQQ
jgi:tRNA uridine 5-carboxymethylaminomethyl modification enzyme